MESRKERVTRRQESPAKPKTAPPLVPIVDADQLKQVQGAGEEGKPGDAKKLWATAKFYSAKASRKPAESTKTTPRAEKKQSGRKAVVRTAAKVSPKRGSRKLAVQAAGDPAVL